MVIPFRVKTVNRLWICLYSLSGLLLVVCFLQVIMNHKETISINSSTYSKIEKEYINKFNLMDGSVKVDEECTLGMYIFFKTLDTSYLYKYFINYTRIKSLNRLHDLYGMIP